MGGNIIMDPNMKRSIILDNYQDPRNRGIPTEDGYIKINSNNDSCIDNIDIYVKLEDDVIKDIMIPVYELIPGTLNFENKIKNKGKKMVKTKKV